MNVVPLPVVNLSDIPGRLRGLADDLADEADTRTLVWVRYRGDGEVICGAFGDNPSKAEVVGILQLASQMFSADAGELERGAEG